MTEKERLLSLLAGAKIDRPPFIIPGGMMTMAVVEAMQEAGAYWPKAHVEPRDMAALVRGIHDMAGVENVGVPFCMTVEAEAMGAEVSLGTADSEPKVTAYAIESVDDVSGLRPILSNPNGRVRVVREAVEILRRGCPGTPVIANLTGPISLATSLIDPSAFFRATLKRKPEAHALLRLVTENLADYACALVAAGADLLVIGDPTATGEIVGPSVFREFGLPYLNRLVQEIGRARNVKTIVHICGDIRSIVPELKQLRAVGLSVDSAANLKTLRQELTGKILMGNVSTALLAESSPDRVATAGRQSLRDGVDILSPACGISPKTPLENLRALSRIPRENCSPAPAMLLPSQTGSFEAVFGITLQPGGKRSRARHGQTLFDALQDTGADIEGDCGGQGICGKCRVRILDGLVSPISEEETDFLAPEETERGIRLACLTRALGPMSLEISGRTDGTTCRILTEGRFVPHAHDPVVTKQYLDDRLAPKPGLSLVESVEAGLGAEIRAPSLALLRALPTAVNKETYGVTAVLRGGRAVMTVEPGDTRERCFGVAVDLGTTTVVASLADLGSGKEIGVAASMNAQRSYGADVLSRIHRSAETPDGAAQLQALAVKTIDDLLGRLCREHRVDRNHIYEVTVAGNPTMLHLFLGVPAASIGKSPYQPVLRSGLDVNAGEIGLDISEAGRLYCLPSVSGYVGADIVAGIVATGLQKTKAPALFIDLGTNGEIVLAQRGEMAACSCAAGPAWEGMNITCGMIAVDGAIESVEISDGLVRYRTIGEGPPAGLCGSGVIDLVGELLRTGLVNPSGRLMADGSPPRFVVARPNADGGREISLGAKDIRQVQLARAAVTSGIRILLKESGLDWKDLSKILIAGAFGRHLRPESLERIGLVPCGAGDKVSFVGNTSKVGALLCLLSSEKRKEAEQAARAVRYVELSTYPEYEKLFLRELAFPTPRENQEKEES